MFDRCFAINQNVIQENNDTSVQEGAENIIHEGHECGRGIRESKWKYAEFIVAILGSEGSLRDILFFNPYLIVSRMQI